MIKNKKRGKHKRGKKANKKSRPTWAPITHNGAEIVSQTPPKIREGLEGGPNSPNCFWKFWRKSRSFLLGFITRREAPVNLGLCLLPIAKCRKAFGYIYYSTQHEAPEIFGSLFNSARGGDIRSHTKGSRPEAPRRRGSAKASAFGLVFCTGDRPSTFNLGVVELPGEGLILPRSAALLKFSKKSVILRLVLLPRQLP